MPLNHCDVKPGVISFLRSTDITSSRSVVTRQENAGRLFRDGPWLCIASDGQYSSWLSLTSRQSQKGDRMQIPRSAFLDGPHRMLTQPNFITDLRYPYSGPVDLFVTASHIEHSRTAKERPRVSPRFLEDVLARMRYYHSVPRWVSELATA